MSGLSDSDVERLIVRLLKNVPERWEAYDWSTLTELEARALSLLVAAGMIERRITFRLVAVGSPLSTEATITFTGEAGWRQALEYVVASTWNDWRAIFEERNSGEFKTASMFHCQRVGREQWRLTEMGVEAQRDLDTDEKSIVLDFVLRRRFFDGRRRLDNGRITQRLPVPGKGTLEQIARVSPSSLTGVNIANWPEGAEALARVLAELFEKTNPRGKREAKGTPDSSQRRRGQKLTDDERKTYLRVIKTAKQLELAHRRRGRIAEIAAAAKVEVEVARNALKWGRKHRRR
jgi:hypothetical protein